MKKVLIGLVMILAAGSLLAEIERRPLEAVSVDAFTSDTQAYAKGAGDSHMAMVWWIPNEFWRAMFMRDASMGPEQLESMLGAFAGHTVLAIVQADISPVGGFGFYPKDAIREHLDVTFTGAAGDSRQVQIVDDAGGDLGLMLQMITPVLSSAMGNMGSNLHFYVLDNGDPAGPALLDPYGEGVMHVKLVRADGKVMDASIELPVNALFVPRICPNGKEAHVSWNYCPWSGEKLD